MNSIFLVFILLTGTLATAQAARPEWSEPLPIPIPDLPVVPVDGCRVDVDAPSGGRGDIPSCVPYGNPVQRENEKLGDPFWVIPAERRAAFSLEGYTSSPSVNRGDRISFLVNAEDDPAYVMQIYRLGWYHGAGARLLLSVQVEGHHQPSCAATPVISLTQCHWGHPYDLRIPYNESDPTDWASGFYLVKLTGNKTGKQSYIPFVVRDDTRRSDIKFLSATATWEAYNPWGHYDLYEGGPSQTFADRARKVSLDRPFYHGFGAGELLNLGYEFSSLRFLEREGFDVTYTSELRLHENRDELLKSKVAFFAGHSEYWTRAMRDSLQSSIAAGVSAIFMDANSIYWQARMEPDGDKLPNRTIVCYKDATEDPDATNPETEPDTTVKFRDPPVNWPEEPLLGAMFNLNSDLGTQGDLVIHDASNWVFAETGLKNGDHLVNFLGPEVDSSHGLSPEGTQVLTESPFKASLGDGVAEMTIYQTGSGAFVFDSGTSRFAYGLDDFRLFARTFAPNLIGLAEGTVPGPSPAVQQVMRNLLLRMGSTR